MREWHGWVGCFITMTMALRVIIPQLPDALVLMWRCCSRPFKARRCCTMEEVRNVYTNPPFELSEAYAEVAVTASIALIFGPAIPILQGFAAISILTRYCVDWVTFLRGAARPAFYDEEIAKVCFEKLLLAVVGRTVTALCVFGDS